MGLNISSGVTVRPTQGDELGQPRYSYLPVRFAWVECGESDTNSREGVCEVLCPSTKWLVASPLARERYGMVAERNLYEKAILAKHVVHTLRCFQSSFSSLQQTVSKSAGGGGVALPFRYVSMFQPPMNPKHKTVRGTLIATYSHQFLLISKVAWPSVPWDVLKKPMPKMLLTREAGRKSIDRIWMIRRARLSRWEARAIWVDSVAILIFTLKVVLVRFVE